MKRKLFCEISPLTYRISTKKEILMRKIRDLPLRGKFAGSNRRNCCRCGSKSTPP